MTKRFASILFSGKEPQRNRQDKFPAVGQVVNCNTICADWPSRRNVKAPSAADSLYSPIKLRSTGILLDIKQVNIPRKKFKTAIIKTPMIETGKNLAAMAKRITL